jgi:glutamate-1-semialdehyde aminotransferase
VKAEKKDIKMSDMLYDRAKLIIPAATQTLAKGTTQFIKGVAPKFLKSGKGSHVWDVDGNEYIDYVMGVGPIILGYAYPVVDEAIRKQLEFGITFSQPHPLEVELAELLIEIIPSAEAVRYGKNGNDVTSAAVRLARAYTGKEHVVCCGYHGWQDWYIAITSRNRGVPSVVQAMTHTFQYNDIHSLEEVFDKYKGKIACVIMEPVTVEEPKSGFLEEVKKLTHENEAILIFDEIWTGFRYALGGAQEMFNVNPDLSTFSKAMANGMPISALVGKKEIMDLLDRDIFYFLTLGGEALSLAASVATIREIKEKDAIKHIWNMGEKIKDGFHQIVKELNIDHLTSCNGYPCKTVVDFKGDSGFDPLEMKSLVQQELIKRGVLWGGIHTLCYTHTKKDVRHTLEAYSDALEILKRATETSNLPAFLEGKPVEEVFRKQRDFNFEAEEGK